MDNMQDILKNYYASGGKELFETRENLDEAPIDDYSKDPSAFPHDATADNVGLAMGVMASGVAIPFFMDISTAAQIGGAVGGGIVGLVLGSLIATMDDADLQPYEKVRKQTAKQMAGAPINTAIRSDIRTFMNNMLNNIPADIKKYGIEIRNISAYGNQYTGDTFSAPFDNIDSDKESDLTKRTEVVADLLKDYLKKQNSIFDQVAKKHNITPLQLGAMAFILYGDSVENAFVKRLQSNLTK